MIFYQFQWNYSITVDSWKLIINPNIKGKSDKINWFKKNKNKYGNFKYIFKRVFIIYFIFASIDFSVIVPSKLYNIPEFGLYLLLDGFLYLTPLCFTMILYKLTPNFQDYVFIQKELKTMCYFILLNVILCLLLGIADNFYNDIWITSFIANILLIITGFGVCYIQTFWILNKFNIDSLSLSKLNGKTDIDDIIQIIHKKIFQQSHKISHAIHQDIDDNDNDNDNEEIEDNSHISQQSPSITTDSISTTIFINDNNNNLLLSKIISNNKLYDLFIIHLCKELNSECLLSLTEFIQFKQYLLLNLKDKYKDLSQYKNDNPVCISIFEGSLFISLPTNMPKSYIIYGQHNESTKSVRNSLRLQIDSLSTNDTKLNKNKLIHKDIDKMTEIEFKRKCIKIINELFLKYCKIESEYEINISFFMREKLQTFVDSNIEDIVDKVKFEEIYKLFDDVIDEMFSLMSQSSNNFVQTFDFLQFKHKYLKKRNKQ